ncbi:MAG: hypothetical protein Kow00107_08270 [Planctomycetota bacterium]
MDYSMERGVLMTAVQGSSFDFDDAMHRLAGERELFFELAEMVLSEVAQYSADLTAAAAACDAEKVSYVAHTLKGTAANVSAVVLVRYASELSAAGKSGDFRRVSEIADEMLRERDRLAVELEHLRSSSEGSDS